MPVKRALGFLLDDDEEEPAKRQLVSDNSSYLKEAWDVIRGDRAPQLIEDLKNPKKTSRIPSLDSGNRSTMRIIGMEDMNTLLCEWGEVMSSEGYALVLKGAKGVGKSTRLKALAFILYSTLPAHWRLICIWNMEVARENLLRALQDALLFTYSAEVMHEISSFQNCGDARLFISKRQTQDVERFILIVDGVQELDVQTWYCREKVDAQNCSNVLSELEDIAVHCNVLWGISPMGGKMLNLEEKPRRNVTLLDVHHGFADASMSTFLAQTCLGAVLKTFPERGPDVQYYCGHFPLFLYILDGLCRRHAKDVLQGTTNDVTQLAQVMEDPEHWDAVLSV